MQQQIETMATADYSFFIGDWQNSNESSFGLAGFSIIEGLSGPEIQVTGIAGGYFPGDWGTAPAQFLVSAPGQRVASAFQASYNLGDRTVFLAGNINKGLVIIAVYALSDSEEPSLFVREFYFKK